MFRVVLLWLAEDGIGCSQESRGFGDVYNIQAPAFVSDVHDFLTEGQEVPVKILDITPEGKIKLSVKQAMTKPERPARREPAFRRPEAAQPAAPPAEPAEQTFEDKLRQFMSVSDSKQSELSRYMAGKRGGSRRRK